MVRLPLIRYKQVIGTTNVCTHRLRMIFNYDIVTASYRAYALRRYHRLVLLCATRTLPYVRRHLIRAVFHRRYFHYVVGTYLFMYNNLLRHHRLVTRLDTYRAIVMLFFLRLIFPLLLTMPLMHVMSFRRHTTGTLRNIPRVIPRITILLPYLLNTIVGMVTPIYYVTRTTIVLTTFRYTLSRRNIRLITHANGLLLPLNRYIHPYYDGNTTNIYHLHHYYLVYHTFYVIHTVPTKGHVYNHYYHVYANVHVTRRPYRYILMTTIYHNGIGSHTTNHTRLIRHINGTLHVLIVMNPQRNIFHILRTLLHIIRSLSNSRSFLLSLGGRRQRSLHYGTYRLRHPIRGVLPPILLYTMDIIMLILFML